MNFLRTNLFPLKGTINQCSGALQLYKNQVKEDTRNFYKTIKILFGPLNLKTEKNYYLGLHQIY